MLEQPSTQEYAVHAMEQILDGIDMLFRRSSQWKVGIHWTLVRPHRVGGHGAATVTKISARIGAPIFFTSSGSLIDDTKLKGQIMNIKV